MKADFRIFLRKKRFITTNKIQTNNNVYIHGETNFIMDNSSKFAENIAKAGKRGNKKIWNGRRNNFFIDEVYFS
jgi:hypothetical protein